MENPGTSDKLCFFYQLISYFILVRYNIEKLSMWKDFLSKSFTPSLNPHHASLITTSSSTTRGTDWGKCIDGSTSHYSKFIPLMCSFLHISAWTCCSAGIFASVLCLGWSILFCCHSKYTTYRSLVPLFHWESIFQLT